MIFYKMSRFVSRFWNEIDATDVGGAVILVAVLFVLGLESSAIGVLLGIVVGVPIVRAAGDATDLEIGPALAGLVLGSFVVVAGVYGHLSGDHWLGSALVVIGAWICLDSVDRWRGTDFDTNPSEDDISNEELFQIGEYNRWLLEELREADRPLTADEIRSRTGLTEDDFERLLEIHGESGPIERVGNGYTIDETDMGAVAFVRNLVRTVGSRVLRPFRLFRPSG